MLKLEETQKQADNILKYNVNINDEFIEIKKEIWKNLSDSWTKIINQNQWREWLILIYSCNLVLHIFQSFFGKSEIFF